MGTTVERCEARPSSKVSETAPAQPPGQGRSGVWMVIRARVEGGYRVEGEAAAGATVPGRAARVGTSECDGGAVGERGGERVRADGDPAGAGVDHAATDGVAVHGGGGIGDTDGAAGAAGDPGGDAGGLGG